MSAFESAATIALLAALGAPYLFPLRRARPLAAIAVWLLVLALRALGTVGLAAAALVGLADVKPVRGALDWCWHEVLPDLPGALGFAEHPVTHAAVAVPFMVLVGSVIWLVISLVRGSLAVRRQLADALGKGPHGSTVVHDERVLVAVTGWGRGRLLVSDRALGELDDQELEAGLVHELAHLRRRHRPLLLAASLLAAIGRPLPGTRTAERELRFHVERDADQYTVCATDDPLALASAICKAAGAKPPGAIVGLGGRGRVSQRLEELLDGPRRPGRLLGLGSWALASALLCLFVALAASAPAWALARDGEQPRTHGHGCNHAP